MQADNPEAQRARRRFGLGWWLPLVTIGAGLGLALPVAAFVASTRLGLPAWIIYPLIALAGALQGLLLGITQALALHRTVIAVPRAGWSLITMAGALVAWSLGLLPATFDALGEPLDLTSRTAVAAAVGGGVLLVLVVPVVQWLLLRRVLAGAWLWVLVEGVAIIVAFAATWGVSLAVDTSLPLADIAPSLGLGAALVALVFALITGFGLLMMARPGDADARP